MAGLILVKEIKPGKFKGEAFVKAMQEEADKVANDILLDFELTAGTWEHQVKFEKLVQVGPSSVEIFVGTDDKIYGYVNDGTSPHVIVPKRARALRFPSTFSPKSIPGVLVSGKGGSGGPDVFAQAVMHPGTKARKFDKGIKRVWDRKMKRRLESAIKRGAKESGHAYP